MNALPNDCDRLSLFELVMFFKETWKATVFGGVVVGMLSVVYLTIFPNYQATAYLQLAQVAGSQIEDTGIFIEKIQLPGYFRNHAVDCIFNDNGAVDNFSASLLNKTPIVKLVYQAATPEKSKVCLEGIANWVKEDEEMSVVSFSNITNAKIEDIKKQIEGIQQTASLSDSAHNNLLKKFPNTDYANLVGFSVQKYLLNALHLELDKLRESIDPLKTHSMKIVGNISTHRQNLFMIALSSGFSGGLIIFLFLLLRRNILS